jgi:hypothetical protein
MKEHEIFTTRTRSLVIIFILQILTLFCVGNNLFDDYLLITKTKPDTNIEGNSLPKNYLYIEFGGPTKFLFSTNYERILFHKDNNYYLVRIGVNKNNFYLHNNLYLLASLNYQKRLRKSTLFEIGMGGVYEKSLYLSKYIAFNDIYYELNVGFNFIIKKVGYLRFNCNFLYWDKEFFKPWPGIGFGVTF